MEVALLPPLLTEGVALYEHVGGNGGGAEGGVEGGADGGWQKPSQSTMYSTYRKLPMYGSSSTAGVAVVTKVYVPSSLIGSGTICAHLKRLPRNVVPLPKLGLHLPCTSTPLDVVLTTYSSASSKSVL